MISRKERTLDVYENAGAWMRLLKTVGTETMTAISPVLSAKDTDRMLKALDTISLVCSDAEENMFRDHPHVSNEYIDVFYGNVSDEPRNKVDAGILKRVRKNLEKVLYGKRY